MAGVQRDLGAPAVGVAVIELHFAGGHMDAQALGGAVFAREFEAVVGRGGTVVACAVLGLEHLGHGRGAEFGKLLAHLGRDGGKVDMTFGDAVGPASGVDAQPVLRVKHRAHAVVVAHDGQPGRRAHLAGHQAQP